MAEPPVLALALGGAGIGWAASAGFPLSMENVTMADPLSPRPAGKPVAANATAARIARELATMLQETPAPRSGP